MPIRELPAEREGPWDHPRMHTPPCVCRPGGYRTSQQKIVRGNAIPIARRTLFGSTVAALAMPAIARLGLAAEPIRMGWLATYTGPLAKPTIGFDPAVQYAAALINGAGGLSTGEIARPGSLINAVAAAGTGMLLVEQLVE